MTTPLIVITGPTGSGKSGLAVKLAHKWGGEIICADSRTVYKDMNIGTAKPTANEQKKVRHWLLNVVEPGQRFTAADFQRLAYEAIADIRARKKVPFLVGGTGLYIDAVTLHFVFGPDAPHARREELGRMSLEELKTMIIKQHIAMPENENNKRYLIRSIEKNNISTPGNSMPDADTFVFAIDTGKSTLQEQIGTRIESMFEQNIVQETQHLRSVYGSDNEAMTGNIYTIVGRLLDGEIDEMEAKNLCKIKDWQLAKRQRTWLRRHEYVRWVQLDRAEKEIERILKKCRDA